VSILEDEFNKAGFTYKLQYGTIRVLPRFILTKPETDPADDWEDRFEEPNVPVIQFQFMEDMTGWTNLIQLTAAHLYSDETIGDLATQKIKAPIVAHKQFKIVDLYGIRNWVSDALNKIK